MSNDSSDSGRFAPTEASPIVELSKITDKITKGFVCPACGHLSIEEDEIIGMTCPKCLQKWLINNDIQQMVSISDIDSHHGSALIPTIKCESSKSFKIERKEKLIDEEDISNVFPVSGDEDLPETKIMSLDDIES